MIISRQNSAIKQVRSLKEKKYRDELDMYIVEGVKMVSEALAIKMPVVGVYATEKGKALLDKVSPCEMTELVSEEVYKSVSGETSPQGVIAVLRKPCNNVDKPQSSCILLDGVSDPANVGAIIRTASASGYNDIYMCNCADAYSPKSVRASMSGIFKVRTHSGSVEEVLSAINLPLVVADMKGENVFKKKPEKDFCLVIGNEGHGVSNAVREKSSITVSIPMQNEMESLNASVSAGILMYALKNTQNVK